MGDRMGNAKQIRNCWCFRNPLLGVTFGGVNPHCKPVVRWLVNYRNYRSQTLAYLTTSNLKENCDINISDGFRWYCNPNLRPPSSIYHIYPDRAGIPEVYIWICFMRNHPMPVSLAIFQCQKLALQRACHCFMAWDHQSLPTTSQWNWQHLTTIKPSGINKPHPTSLRISFESNGKWMGRCTNW